MENADIAQLVEQGFCKPQVRGSSPRVGTTYFFGFLGVFKGFRGFYFMKSMHPNHSYYP